MQLFPPLGRAVFVAGEEPDDPLAGGPEVRIVHQEGVVAFLLAVWSIDRIASYVPELERTAFTMVLDHLHAGAARLTELLPTLKGTGNRRTIDDDDLRELVRAMKQPPTGTSPPVVAAIAAIEAFNALPNGFSAFAVRMSATAAGQVVTQLAGDRAAQRAYVSDLADRILVEELAAMMRTKGDTDPMPILRVLWRGADAAGLPAYWLVRTDRDTYGLFWKLGKRWTFTAGDRDNVLANVPDAYFEAAVAISVRRDRGRS